MSERETKTGKAGRTPEEIARRLPRLSADETARHGKEIYHEDIRPQVINDHDGKIVAIDIETRKWALGKDTLEATDRLRVECPNATEVWAERVGYRVTGRLGGSGPLPRDE